MPLREAGIRSLEYKAGFVNPFRHVQSQLCDSSGLNLMAFLEKAFLYFLLGSGRGITGKAYSILPLCKIRTWFSIENPFHAPHILGNLEIP
jgi:hypothetical protein